MDRDQFDNLLAPHGLRVLGVIKDGADSLALIGPDEPRFWAIFSASAAFNDGLDHPLDRWSRRVLDARAEAVDGTAVYPFGGPPYAPFHTWAVESRQAWSSPIGFLVHAQAGLWVSYRGAVRLPHDIAMDPAMPPCPDCAQPCVTACPVDAFADGYDSVACKAHVASPAGQQCRSQGCRARAACPVAAGTRLPAQAAFHMEAFL